MDNVVLSNATVLWDYMKLHQQPSSADCLLVIGSLNDSVAVAAAGLEKAHAYKTIVISGGNSRMEKTRALGWGEDTESEHYLKLMRAAGCERSDILLEQDARHTGENASLTYELLNYRGILPKTMLIVTKPYMERRVHATFDVQWPDRQTVICTTSPDGTLEAYCSDYESLTYTINVMVGDLQRIIEYPQRGLQSYQEVPNSVVDAFRALIRAGYTKHLLKSV